MKTPLKFVSAGVVAIALLPVLYNNCSGAKPGDGNQTMATPKPTAQPLQAQSCDYGSSANAHITTYGNFVPSAMDSCNSYDGDSSPSRWTGMASATALVAPLPAVYASGADCGQCLQIQGPNGTITARVASFCSGCTGDDIDMDETSFQALTGSASGRYAVTVKNVACPLTEPVKFYVNAGSNSYYLNISSANTKHPVVAMEVDPGAGFVVLSRVGTTAAFAASFPNALGATVQVRATDSFGQKVTATISTAIGANPTTVQFADCH